MKDFWISYWIAAGNIIFVARCIFTNSTTWAAISGVFVGLNLCICIWELHDFKKKDAR